LLLFMRLAVNHIPIPVHVFHAARFISYQHAI
jgi:hypothetical protein